MKNKGLWLLLGFVLMILGFTSMIMQLVGVHWAFLGFIEWAGRLWGFVLKIVMVLAGILILVLANTDWERERRESQE